MECNSGAHSECEVKDGLHNIMPMHHTCRLAMRHIIDIVHDPGRSNGSERAVRLRRAVRLVAAMEALDLDLGQSFEMSWSAIAGAAATLPESYKVQAGPDGRIVKHLGIPVQILINCSLFCLASVGSNGDSDFCSLLMFFHMTG